MTASILSALRRVEETHGNLDDTTRHVNVMHSNLTRFLEFASDVNDFDASVINDIRKDCESCCLVNIRKDCESCCLVDIRKTVSPVPLLISGRIVSPAPLLTLALKL
jgi:hypothetical protein